MKARLVIAALIATNVALGTVIAYGAIRLDRARAELDRTRSGIYADHIQQLRMDVQNNVLRVRLGASATAGGPAVTDPRPSGTLVLTPRAAIQLDVELRRMIALIQQTAAAVEGSKALPSKPQSPDQSI